MTRLMFYGDPHGNPAPLKEALEDARADAVILLGDICTTDLDADYAFVKDKGIPLHWVHGNHDCKNAEWYDGLFEKPDQSQSLHGKVTTIGGLRIAGLGGKPRKEIWRPGQDKLTRADYLKTLPDEERWRDGLPRLSRCAVWPEDIEALKGQQADILVTHIWPTSYHRGGQKFLDELAAELKVRLLVHGHLHIGYRGKTKNGIRVRSVPNATAWTVEFLKRG